MKLQRKEVNKPDSSKIRFSVTEMTKEEFRTICNALESKPDDIEAAAILHKFKEIAEE